VNDLRWEVVIDTGRFRREMVLISSDWESAMDAACKVAENMGGDYLSIVSFRLAAP